MKTDKSLQTAAVFCVAALLTQPAFAQPASVGGSSLQGHAQPHAHVHRDLVQPTATPGPTGYFPAQIRQAYGFDLLPSSIDGTGQTIAIIDAFGDRYTTTTTDYARGNKATITTNIVDTTQTDWTNFCTQFGLPTGGLTVVYPQGQGSVNTNWAFETALDIQWAHAIAPGAAILLVVAYDSSSASLYAAVDYAVNAGASLVSMSWGVHESTDSELGLDAHFNHPGVTFLAASGDAGELSSGVWYPAASPYVVSVGGTELTNSNGIWSEGAWSGSGGGISLYETMPVFQNGWQQFPTRNMRSVPDVSYAGGSNSAVSVDCAAKGGWIKVYGTSVGAPQWAALVALANSASSFGTLNGANSVLYSIASTGTNAPYVGPDYFLDIVSGSNGSDSDDFSIPGYDFVTGLGSPMANNLVPALISILNTPDFSLTVSPSSQSVPALAPEGMVSWSATYAININRYGGFSDGVSLSLSGLPAGASANFAPNPAADSSTLSISVPTTATPGAYSLTITGTDTGNMLTNPSRVASAVLSVSSAPTSVSVVQPSGSTGYSVSGAKNNNANLIVQILLRNDFGQPVVGASVSTTLYLNGAAYGSATATTLSDGTASFTVRNAPTGTYTTTVTSVTASGLTWDGKTPANSYTKKQ